MQKWEYIFIYRERGAERKNIDDYFVSPEKWNNSIVFQNGEEEEIKESFVIFINKLGEQGWELISVTPSSKFAGGLSSVSGDTSVQWGSGYGNISGQTVDLAGFTSTEEYIFKRIKE
jgi:hypothetical protein